MKAAAIWGERLRVARTCADYEQYPTPQAYPSVKLHSATWAHEMVGKARDVHAAFAAD